MTVTVAIIGLGQIGASIGLALGEKGDGIIRIGHDIEPKIAKQAQAIGAVDKIYKNLLDTVKNVEVVIIALPFDQIYNTLQEIAPYLQENTVVMDTSILKRAVLDWMKELLPSNRYYIGLVPSINPKYLLEEGRGINSAHADMFSKGLLAIIVPNDTTKEIIELGLELTSLLGAKPFFADPEEIDGIMTALHILPLLTTAVLTNVITGRPGWNDVQKLAGGVFAKATSPIAFEDDNNTLLETTLLNHENVVHVLDEMIDSIINVREIINRQDQIKLSTWILNVRHNLSKWWQVRNTGEMSASDFQKINQKKSDMWKRIFGDAGKLFAETKFRNNKEKK